jgi:hypothetical protein
MKSIKDYIAESIAKLTPDECVSTAEQNGYMDDEYTFRMAEGARTTDKQVEKLIKHGKGRKIYRLGEGYSVQGKAMFFKAFDGGCATFQITFGPDGKFRNSSAECNPNGKLDSDSESIEFGNQEETLEALKKFFDGSLF